MIPLDRSGKLAILKAKAKLLDQLRSWMKGLDVLEIDSPQLVKAPILEQHIDFFEVAVSGSNRGYLTASPEYQMKRLLADLNHPLFQICKAFRPFEQGKQHNPEFILFEWYHPNMPLEQMMAEIGGWVSGQLGVLGWESMSFDEACQKIGGFSSFELSLQDFKERTQTKGLNPPQGLIQPDADLGECRDFLWAFLVEPELGHKKTLFITDYPLDLSPLSKPKNSREAERFELFFKGVELANGSIELDDASLQRKNLLAVQRDRESRGLEFARLDEKLLSALEHPGLGACAGVALGVERLLMLKLELESVDQTMSFGWDEL